MMIYLIELSLQADLELEWRLEGTEKTTLLMGQSQERTERETTCLPMIACERNEVWCAPRSISKLAVSFQRATLPHRVSDIGLELLSNYSKARIAFLYLNAVAAIYQQHRQIMVNLILLSKVLGWIYTTAWSTSFYPQLILNYRRKSVSGLSLDFLFLNVLGFACYAVSRWFSADCHTTEADDQSASQTSNVVLYSPDSIRQEYRGRNDGSNPSVQLNDVAFASHALLISSLTLLQSFLYKRDANQRLSSFNRTFILAAMASIGLATIGVELIDRIGWLDLMYLLSYIKIYISFAKYVPQALLNIQRKSTIGWSIINILLDFTGGTLSLWVIPVTEDLCRMLTGWSNVEHNWF